MCFLNQRERIPASASPASPDLSFIFLLHVVENLLGALLRIKEVIRRRVESSEDEDTDERGMTQRLEDILKESSGEMRTKNKHRFKSSLPQHRDEILTSSFQHNLELEAELGL